jgi:Zn-dependent M28 family amino/carboxypeptidase
MKSCCISLLAALAASAHAQANGWNDWEKLPAVTSEALQALVSVDDLVAGAETLQGFADANGGNRVFGGPGHNATVFYLYDTLKATGYYDVELQEFVELYSGGSAILSTNGEEQEAELLTYTPSGFASAPLVAVNNLGCTPGDFPADVDGAIALISRGECTFAEKATYALSAGAVGAVVYNNVEGPLAGTLGGVGDYPPTVGITQEAGESLLALLTAGTVVDGELVVDAILENRTTYNVIAETKGGDHDNVVSLGAHTDSVDAGPGM